jgi:hypothetical protein
MKQGENGLKNASLSGLDAFPARYDADAGRSVCFGVKGSAPKKFIKLTILGRGLAAGDLTLNGHWVPRFVRF